MLGWRLGIPAPATITTQKNHAPFYVVTLRRLIPDSIMGWMRTLLLGDIGNRLDIADAEREISLVRSSQARSARTLQAREVQINALRDELGRQKLAIQALTRFLVDRNVISKSELDEFIEEVDAEDGATDGKMSLDPVKKRLVFLEPEHGGGKKMM